MASDSVANYEAVLADLRVKRDQIDSAILAIEGLMVGITSPGSSAKSVSSGQTEEVKSDSFFGMSIPDAARKFLQMSKKPRSTQEICEALEKGGLTHSSANFGNTVGSVMNRVDASGGDIVKIGRGTWGLSEWYPGRKRMNVKKMAESISAADILEPTDLSSAPARL